MTEIAPPRGPHPSPPRSDRPALVAGASVAAALLFWSPLLFGGELSGRDWASHHWHYFDWVRTSMLEHGTLPLCMADAWVTPNFWANAESPTLGPLTPLLWLLTTDLYLKLLIVVFTAAGLAGMFRLLRELEVTAPVACAMAAVFAWGGFGVSHLAAGHPWVLGAQLLPWLLLLYRRAALGSAAALGLGALLNAFTILGGQHQPFVWQNLFLGGFALLWALRARAWFPLSRLALLWLASAGLGALKLVPLALEFASYDPEARIAGLPLRLLLATLVASGQHPELVAQGMAYTHGAGWWEYCFYVGAPALLLLLAGLAASRRIWPLFALGLFFTVIALEGSRGGFDPWAWLESLPVWRTQRAPSRFLFLALFAFTVAAAPGLARLQRGAGRRWMGSALAAWGLAVIVGADLFAQSLPWQRGAVGEAIESTDHRPRPFRFTGPGGAVGELRGFAPNRLVYHLRAPAATSLELPLRPGLAGPIWRSDDAALAQRNGALVVQVGAGERDVVLRCRPPGLIAGLALSAASLAALAVTALGRRRRREKP